MGMAREPSRSTPSPSFLCLKTAQGTKGAGGSWWWWGLGDAAGNFYLHWNACGDPWSSRRGWAVSEGICVHACKESVASPHGWDTGSLSGFPLDAFTSAPAAALWAGVGWRWESWSNHLHPGLSLPCGETNPMEQALLSTGVSHCQMLYSLQTPPGRCDMGEHSCVLER